ncbi:MAG: GSCFA domain-containing protein [Pseudorhodobacter sp.]
MTNPYQDLPETAFWRSGVADMAAEQMRGLWQPRFDISPDMPIVTAGSCFAQHIGRALKARGYHWYDAEPAPGPEALRHAFYYGVFSFRTGNIYTTRMLHQWFDWALHPKRCPDLFWCQDGRVHDPFRPTIEPDGFDSVEEGRTSRQATLAAIRDAMRKARLFIFTLGLTECWRDSVEKVEYAVCPGTIAGSFDPGRHQFHNMTQHEVLDNLNAALALLRNVNPGVKILLTVSPVPLTATASGQHVLTATTYSKSVLRAAAGTIMEENEDVDYFPSYEIITSPVFGGRFYASNMRGVTSEGVSHVMTCFFDDLSARFGTTSRPDLITPSAAKIGDDQTDDAEDLRCEEEMLASFQTPGQRTAP